MPDFWFQKGPSFALIAFPGEEILWKSAAKALTFCAKYRKYHPALAFLTSGSSEEAGEVLLPAERRECARAVDGFVQYHLGLDLGQGALPENVIRKFRTLKNGLLWLFFRKGIPRLVSAAIVMEEACIFRM